jgi:hypothetical protein
MDMLRLGTKERQRIVNELKTFYPIGTRVELLSMNDPHITIPIGTEGTVRSIDDIGTIFVTWDNGSGLGVVYGEDKITIVPTD